MKEPYGEDLASRPDPESCVRIGNGAGEALTGAHVGPVSSCEIRSSGVPTRLSQAEGHTGSVAEVSAFDQVTTYNIGAEYDAVVSMDGFGDYLVTYTTFVGTSGDTDVHARVGYLPS